MRAILLKLREARKIFEELRFTTKIIIRRHAWAYHVERGFTEDEIRALLRGHGSLTDNKYPSAQKDSFLFICADIKERKVEIALLLEDNIIVIHAYRNIGKFL